MRRLVGTSVALVVLVACSGHAAPSGVAGALEIVGGPAPGFTWRTAGTVWVYPDTGESEGLLIAELPSAEPLAKFGAGSSGEFSGDLPPGTYLLTAVRSQGYPCVAQRIQVKVGQYTRVTVDCPE
jgi:hypothetical protein